MFVHFITSAQPHSSSTERRQKGEEKDFFGGVYIHEQGGQTPLFPPGRMGVLVALKGPIPAVLL